MLKYYLLIVLPIISVCFPSSCDGQKASNEDGRYVDYHWESSRKKLLSSTDMVLIYGGSKHRDVTWNKDHFAPYVSYVDESNKEQWLFDSYLFIEMIDGQGKIFATGFYGQPATKKEWTLLVDYLFTEDNCMYALENSIEDASKRLGRPTEKRKVVVVVPEPIVAGPGSYYPQQTKDYWGKVGGKSLDFTNDDDRVAACKWYIDYVRERFNEGKFKNIELAGFYWLAEETLHTSTILLPIGKYLNEKMYSFNWIPYWKTNPDYYNWQSFGFNYSYLQPNYFFNDNVPYSRLNDACAVVKQYDLDLELEFDMDVMVDGKNRGSRLYDYMKAFRENGMLETKRIAYYQDCDALYHLYKSQNTQNKKIYHDFCTFVVEHQKLYRNK